MSEAKNLFDIEIKRYENLKALGHPVRSNMDSILYDHGINKIGAFGGSVDGNDCHRMIYNSESAVGDIMDFLL